MPKAKLVLSAADLKKLPASAHLAGVTPQADPFKSGSEFHTEISFRDPSQLVKLGGIMATISETELKAFEDRQAKKAAKSAAAKA